MAWALLALSALCGGFGLLTVFKCPEWLDWRLAVAAGQFGYALAVVPLACGLAAAFLPRSAGAPRVLAAAVAAAAFVLLLLAPMEAWRISRGLPARLDRAFGPSPAARPAFSWPGLFRRWPQAGPPTTFAYSGGLQLDAYRPAGAARAPCVVVIHGGGWDNGAKGQIPQFNALLASRGLAVADISYRLAPGSVWPAQRDDVAAALAFVKRRGPEWGADPERIVLFGRSAGGQIAEACAYGLREPAVRGVAALYAPADMAFAWEWGRPDDVLDSLALLRNYLGGDPRTAAAAFHSASGIALVGPGSPPTLLIHGTLDTLVWCRQSERLAARLEAAGVPHVFVPLPWAVHALEFNPSGPSGQLAAYAVERFVRAVCR